MYPRFIILLFALFPVMGNLNCKKASHQPDDVTKQETISIQKKESDLENNSDIVSLSPESLKKITLRMDTVRLLPIQHSIRVPGQVRADQNREAFVESLIDGRVYDVMVNEGDIVQKGDVLLRLESLKVSEIKNEYIKARAELEFAAAAYVRLDTLYKQNVGSLRSVLEAKANYEKAQALFSSTDNNLHSIGISDEEAQKDMSYIGHNAALLSIKSPIRGTVVERNISIGNLVTPSVSLMRIIDLSTVWVDAQVFEKDLPFVQKGDRLSLTVTALPGKIFEGKIILVNKILETETRTVKVRAEVLNSDGVLLPGMYGDARLLSSGKVFALLIPSSAVHLDEAKHFVFIPGNKPGEFVRRFVKVGSTINEMMEILEGLQEGDRVITEGSFFLKAESNKGSFEEE